ncbi:MAG TPA: hypothetical protein VN372_07965 [Methanospirillum sp.]|nr:hypothetical protein [Methanospirillum sp.]
MRKFEDVSDICHLFGIRDETKIIRREIYGNLLNRYKVFVYILNNKERRFRDPVTVSQTEQMTGEFKLNITTQKLSLKRENKRISG